jgi:Mu transposase, C-terminal domain
MIATVFTRLDFNTRLQDWLGIANRRRKRSLGCSPADRIASVKAAMLSLLPVPPSTGWDTRLRLPRDHYVRSDSNDYSVHPSAVGRRVLVRADQYWTLSANGEIGRRPSYGRSRLAISCEG